jgi:hypothetical protein
MKIMISWQLHEGKLHDTLSLFSAMSAEQEQAMMGDQLRLIGRWHDLVRGTGVAIYETENAAALSTYALQWNEHMDLDIAVVTDDDEARAIGKTLSNPD